MDRLIQRIQEEKDHARFTALVRDLNDLLKRKEQRIEPHSKKPKF